MAATLEELRSSFGKFECPDCKHQGCALKLAGLPKRERFILDCDEYRQAATSSPPGRCCDRIVVQQSQGVSVAAVELKRGSLNAIQAAEQLRGGARLAEQIIDGSKPSFFFPILLHGRAVRRAEYRILEKRHVTFRGRTRRVIVEKCGVSWKSIREKYARNYAL